MYIYIYRERESARVNAASGKRGRERELMGEAVS